MTPLLKDYDCVRLTEQKKGGSTYTIGGLDGEVELYKQSYYSNRGLS